MLLSVRSICPTLSGAFIGLALLAAPAMAAPEFTSADGRLLDSTGIEAGESFEFMVSTPDGEEVHVELLANLAGVEGSLEALGGGTWRFHAPSRGAFAGTQWILARAGGEERVLEVNVPFQVWSSGGREGGQAIRVLGAAGGERIVLESESPLGERQILEIEAEDDAELGTGVARASLPDGSGETLSVSGEGGGTGSASIQATLQATLQASFTQDDDDDDTLKIYRGIVFNPSGNSIDGVVVRVPDFYNDEGGPVRRMITGSSGLERGEFSSFPARQPVFRLSDDEIADLVVNSADHPLKRVPGPECAGVDTEVNHCELHLEAPGGWVVVEVVGLYGTQRTDVFLEWEDSEGETRHEGPFEVRGRQAEEDEEGPLDTRVELPVTGERSYTALVLSSPGVIPDVAEGDLQPTPGRTGDPQVSIETVPIHIVTTRAPIHVTETRVALEGLFVSNLQPGTAHFEYGRVQDALEKKSDDLPIFGGRPDPQAMVVERLECDTEYFYRAVGVTTEGGHRSEGAVRSFRTRECSDRIWSCSLADPRAPAPRDPVPVLLLMVAAGWLLFRRRLAPSKP
jgi:hypothetical protein